VEGAPGADPSLESGLGEFRFQLLKAGQAEGEAVKGGEENGRGRYLGREAGIGQSGGGGAEIEDLIQVAGEGGKFVSGVYLAFS